MSHLTTPTTEIARRTFNRDRGGFRGDQFVEIEMTLGKALSIVSYFAKISASERNYLYSLKNKAVAKSGAESLGFNTFSGGGKADLFEIDGFRIHSNFNCTESEIDLGELQSFDSKECFTCWNGHMKKPATDFLVEFTKVELTYDEICKLANQILGDRDQPCFHPCLFWWNEYKAEIIDYCLKRQDTSFAARWTLYVKNEISQENGYGGIAVLGGFNIETLKVNMPICDELLEYTSGSGNTKIQISRDWIKVERVADEDNNNSWTGTTFVGTVASFKED